MICILNTLMQTFKHTSGMFPNNITFSLFFSIFCVHLLDKCFSVDLYLAPILPLMFLFLNLIK